MDDTMTKATKRRMRGVKKSVVDRAIGWSRKDGSAALCNIAIVELARQSKLTPRGLLINLVEDWFGAAAARSLRRREALTEGVPPSVLKGMKKHGYEVDGDTMTRKGAPSE